MKKNRESKLRLHRETVVRLENGKVENEKLEKAQGAIGGYECTGCVSGCGIYAV